MPTYNSINEAITAGALTPLRVAATYNMPASDGTGVKIGIISAGGGYLASDLEKSLTELGVTTPQITTVVLDGASTTFNSNVSAPNNFSLENTLDLYCVASLVPAANIVLYVGADILSAGIRAIKEDCAVISISYVTTSANAEIKSQAESIIADAVRKKKITILAASGDYGSAGNAQQTSLVPVTI